MVTRALKEVLLKAESRGLQLLFVGHDIKLPDELAPCASRFDVEPMTLPRVRALFSREMARQRQHSGRDVAGCRQAMDSLLRHMVGLPEASVRHLARVMQAQHGGLGAAELLVFEQRLLGTLLTWMSERQGRVFLVDTANDINSLPPGLMRKGRFDEIFFVDLPSASVREGILRIHLGKHQIPCDAAAVQQAVQATTGFSGAEIEAAVVAARYEAHAQGQKPDMGLLMQEVARTKPLSVTRAEAVAALRAWAAERTVAAGAVKG